jgi:predicted nucleic acid-binding protein
MPDRVFLDTNILVYAFDREDARRQAIAAELFERHLKDRTAVLSLQVLQEFFVVVTRKIKSPLASAQARRLVADFLRHNVVETSPIHLLEAMDLSITDRLSFWDAMIIVTAVRAGCKIIYTEDLRSESSVKGVRIVNPFKA